MKRQPIQHPTETAAMLIPLTQGQFAIVDKADAEIVCRWNWGTFQRKASKTLYAQRHQRTPNGRQTVDLHVFLWGLWGNAPAKHLDHKNLNGLDCRRRNLRAASPGQNIHSRGKVWRAGAPTSALKGVCRHRDAWVANIMFEGKRHYLGRFKTQEEAGRAYNESAIRLYGDFASTN